MSLTTNLEVVLKTNHYNVTKQRQLVFGLLTGQEPMSIRELTKRAAGRLDRASIYRIITIFEEIGVVQRINIGWKYRVELSDRFTAHHHHLTCLKCHKIIPITEDELEIFIDKVADRHQFRTTSHQVEMQGYCQACA